MIEIPEQAASLHMSIVILWRNGMVMVFDDAGQQMPEYQGRVEVVATRINAIFSGEWEYGDWQNGIVYKRAEMLLPSGKRLDIAIGTYPNWLPANESREMEHRVVTCLFEEIGIMPMSHYEA